LVGTSKGRWEDNIKIDIKEKGMDGSNWIRLAQEGVHWWAFVNKVMNFRVP
jgi:hypothetical protein